MRVLDVSVPIRPGMVTYPGDPQVQLRREKSIADGDVANISRLDFGVHTGTHVDAPLHFVEGGPAAEQLSLDVLVGPAVVVDATGVEGELGEDLTLPAAADRILFKTRNSELWASDEFAEDFVRVGVGLARRLVSQRIRLVGVDYLSVGNEAVHEILLSMGVVVVEGLDLRAVEPGPYTLVCAPLRLVGSDGAPARTLLLAGDSSDGG
jgi:arylformamidase